MSGAMAWYCCGPVPKASAHSAKDEERDGGQAVMGPWVEGEEPVGKVASRVGTAWERDLIVEEEYGCGPWHKLRKS